MALALSTTVRNNMLDTITTAIGSTGKLRIYDGSRPASGGTATTLLAEIPFANPAGSGASSGVLTFTVPISDSSANASGTATWARVVDGSSTFVADMDVSDTAGSGELKLITTTIVATQPVQISSFTITAGNA